MGSNRSCCYAPCWHVLQEEDELAEGEVEGISAMPDEGWGRAGPPRVVTLEQCLTWGGEQRQRCRVVIAVSGTPH